MGEFPIQILPASGERAFVEERGACAAHDCSCQESSDGPADIAKGAATAPPEGNGATTRGSHEAPADISKGAMPASPVPAAMPGMHGRTPLQSKTFFVETFGCAMNVHDSEKVAGVLMARGYQAAEEAGQADILFYNTCSIREKAAQKVFSRLGQLKKHGRGDQVIGVLGCVAQQEGEKIFERAPHVSLVCGSASYSALPSLLDEVESGRRRVTGLSLATEDCFETEMTRRDNRFRAYVTIIEGCDKRCSYCVVPMTRGPERSLASGRVLEQCLRLAEEGFTEIQLLGQTVNSYRDPSPARLSFADLLAAVAQIPGVRRVRFTTSHPRDFSKEIVDAIDAYPALCDQIHLPVQSGSNAVLKKMLRTYTREEYLEKLDCIKSAKRAISISTDIIVGFCGETPDDFEQTISLLDQAGYDQIFSFKYSPRPVTRAGAWTDDVPDEEKGRRLAILQERQRQIQLERNQALVGREFEVLVEGFHPKLGQAVGRTSSNRVVNFSGRQDWVGQYMNVRVASAGPNSLVGEAL